MNQRLLFGVLICTVACSGEGVSGDETGGAAGISGVGGSGVGAGGTPNGGTGPSTGGQSTSGGSTGSGTGGGMNGGTTATGGVGGGAAGNGGSAGGSAGASGAAGAAGGGGVAGASGAAGMAGMGGMTVDTDQSVLERNKHASRDGYFVQPMLDATAAAKMAKDANFKPSFTGSMWASPLYLANGPGGKGVFFAVTTENNVYAFDETTGAEVWHKNIGSSPTANGVACGSIHPLGILSTPVIDAAARTIYVAGAIGTTSISRHEVHALSVDDGTEKTGYPVNVTPKSGSTTFTAPPQNQRSALSLVNGIVYVAYGGHVGDCDNYHGWVFAIDTKDPTKTGGWATLGAKGEGIWASGGMASDGNGVFAVTGNNTAGVTDHMASDTEEIVRITGLGVLNRSNQNLFFPSRWRTMDTGDQDFGSVSPVYISVPGSTPSHFVAAASKDGHLYLLDPANLGGMTPLVDFMVASRSNSLHTAMASYTTAKGTYVTFGTDGNGSCPMGGPTGKVVMGVHIPAGSPPKPEITWCAAQSGAVPGPIATTTDGTANPIVWFMSGSQLVGVDGDTGKVVFQGSGTGNACNGVIQWTSPIAAKGRIVTSGGGTLCSYSPH